MIYIPSNYTPEETFAMVEETDMKEDVKKTIQRMEQEIATLKEQLNKQEKVSEQTYHRGQRFFIDNGSKEYILAHVICTVESCCVCLVDVNSGKRYSDAVWVGSSVAVTVEEMFSMTNGKSFRLIEK